MSRASSEPVRAYSIGFGEKSYDELDKARLLARAVGVEHRSEVLEPSVVEALGDLAWYLDEPFGDSSAIPTYMVSRLAASEVKVVLSGDGGDELFGGYERYLVEGRERRNRFLPSPIRRLLRALGERLPEGASGREMLRHLGLVGGDRYLDACTLFKPDQQRRLFQPEVLQRFDGWYAHAALRARLDDDRIHWLSALQRFDLQGYLPLDILTKVDRMSMAHSIEARVPLLDHRFVELAASIPPELHLRGGAGKAVWKHALEGWVPRELLERKKQGFAVPLGTWFRGRLNGYLRDLLLSPRSLGRGIFSASYLERLLALHESGRPLDLHLWTLVSFELWCRTFLDQPVAARASVAPAVTTGTRFAKASAGPSTRKAR
jgi:asparagine synthase (glutamine-hydrolysing)